MRLSIPRGLYEWWDRTFLPTKPMDPLKLTLAWGKTDLKVGEIHPSRNAVYFDPEPKDFTEGAERTTRLIAKPLTRSGWLRPELDPEALLRLLEIHGKGVRVEFILDTNAMNEGIGHWLVDHFADRCDLVVTAVTLRELQDQHAMAAFSNSLPDKKKNHSDDKKNGRAKVLGARQLYLAANRFREHCGFKRVLWEELPMDDTALLLSRGKPNAKSSESDTLMLRAVRRSINERVNGLERFFVTGDTALARRATSELPQGSVIAAHVQDLRDKTAYFPCVWWPGPDQGCRVGRHLSRVIWEMLALGDTVELKASDHRIWHFQAFVNPMWPSDYREPWVNVEEEHTSTTGGAKSKSSVPHVDQAPAPKSTVESKSSFSIWPTWSSPDKRLNKNLRLSAANIFDLLSVLVLQPGETIPIPEELRNTSVRRYHVRLLLEGLNWAKPDTDVTSAHALPLRAKLTEAWNTNDLDALFDMLRLWAPLDELATKKNPPERPRITQRNARNLAAHLGQGMFVAGVWLPGGQRPSTDAIRQAIIKAIPKKPPRAIPMHTLLVEVFLRKLGVSPVRVVRVWEQLWKSDVFEGFEPRAGGSSSGRSIQEVVRLSSSGWEMERIDLESCKGYRDLVYRSNSHE